MPCEKSSVAGIDPTERRVLVLKSMQHFRPAFESIADVRSLCS
ncbi:MlrC C-terminal domain-containing protein [Paracoccus sp. KR1-242]